MRVPLVTLLITLITLVPLITLITLLLRVVLLKSPSLSYWWVTSLSSIPLPSLFSIEDIICVLLMLGIIITLITFLNCVFFLVNFHVNFDVIRFDGDPP